MLDPALGRWCVSDPQSEKYYGQSPYNYCLNNPLKYTDPDGRFPIETIWDIANVIYDVGAAVYNHIAGDHESAGAYWSDAGIDFTAVLIPYVPAGASKILKVADKAVDAVKAGDKAIDAAKAVDKAVDGSKTFQTYTKRNPQTGEIYSGRTSGKRSPEQNVRKRDINHHKNKEGYEPAIIDKTSTSREAIRGREQQLIDKYGGAKSTGGTSGNPINGISPNNPQKNKYLNKAKKEWGKP